MEYFSNIINWLSTHVFGNWKETVNIVVDKSWQWLSRDICEVYSILKFGKYRKVI